MVHCKNYESYLIWEGQLMKQSGNLGNSIWNFVYRKEFHLRKVRKEELGSKELEQECIILDIDYHEIILQK